MPEMRSLSLQGLASINKSHDRSPQVSYRVNAVDHEAVAFGIYAARRSFQSGHAASNSCSGIAKKETCDALTALTASSHAESN